MNTLKLCKYRCSLRFTRKVSLPPFIGNTLRGTFGRLLCDNYPDVYGRVFKVDGAESAPNPFVISAAYPSKGEYGVGDELAFFITLFGSACEFEKEVAGTVRFMCEGRLAHAESAEIEPVYAREWSDDGAASISHCDALTVNFLTPTEILSGNRTATELSFNAMVDSLFGRIGYIIDNYTDGEFVLPYSLIARRPFVKAECDLKQVRLQTSGQPINGFVGTIKYSGDVTKYLPYIDLGSQIHIGKKTTRSCGEYSFEIR
jgi:hypothetical protein